MDRMTRAVIELSGDISTAMPRMSGEEAFQAIREIREDACVIVMSGYSMQDALSRFSGRSIAGFLKKPFPLTALKTTIRKVLED